MILAQKFTESHRRAPSHQLINYKVIELNTEENSILNRKKGKKKSPSRDQKKIKLNSEKKREKKRERERK